VTLLLLLTIIVLPLLTQESRNSAPDAYADLLEQVRNVQGTCKEHPARLGNIQGTFREISGNIEPIQGTFREHFVPVPTPESHNTAPDANADLFKQVGNVPCFRFHIIGRPPVRVHWPLKGHHTRRTLSEHSMNIQSTVMERSLKQAQ
jgi:hypothetical protein